MKTKATGTMQFTCLRCGGHSLECVNSGVTIISPVAEVAIVDVDVDVGHGEEAVVVYDGIKETFGDGEICFQCAECGRELEGVHDDDSLIAYLEEVCVQGAMELTEEQMAIMTHTANRAAGGLFCGDSPDMQELVKLGFMRSAGRKSFGPDEYFALTNAGKAFLAAKTTKKE